MSCPNNIQDHKFLFWRWKSEGGHDLKITKIEKFMFCSVDWVVSWRCGKCGTTKQRSFVETEELLRADITIEQLDNISERHTLYL